MAIGRNAIQLVRSLPRNGTSFAVGRQLLRSATSVGANCRSACSAKSHADSLAKMAMVQEEGDESLYWIELLVRAGQVDSLTVEALMKEGKEGLALVIASIRTARSRR